MLSAWAKHFRNHYCSDAEIDTLKPSHLSRAEFLRTLVFPDARQDFGPATRAGDFCEILVADYVEYNLKYWVPRTRYRDKHIRNESAKGCDVIGIKLVRSDAASPNDSLFLVEVKAQLSDSAPANKLQEAVNDSTKDEIRKAESLYAIKRTFVWNKQVNEVARIERFQNPVDFPYLERYGAAAVVTSESYDPSLLQQTDASAHNGKGGLSLIVIKGISLMTLVHSLFSRAADEA